MIQEIVDSIEDLTSFPPLAHRALSIAMDNDAGVDDLIELVQFDPAVTSNCLRLCNSSYFGLSEKISSLKQALVFLGMRNIINVLLTHCIKLPEYDRAHGGYGLHEGELWRHSVSCAVLSGRLSEKAGCPPDPALFTAALLHDVGKLVLSRFLEKRYRALCDLIQNRLSLIQAEKALFGIHHAELGGIIAETWNFPDALIRSIQDHHRPIATEGEPDIVSWVGLSNAVAHLCAFRSTCFHSDVVCCFVAPQILKRFGLHGADVDAVAESHESDMMVADDLFSGAA